MPGSGLGAGDSVENEVVMAPAFIKISVPVGEGALNRSTPTHTHMHTRDYKLITYEDKDPFKREYYLDYCWGAGLWEGDGQGLYHNFEVETCRPERG